MELWNNIVNTAMLGTGKKIIGANELTADLTDALSIINANNSIDAEERFLQTASVALNYRQAGFLPLHKEGLHLPSAPDEDKMYCSAVAVNILKDILSEENDHLLKLWLGLCSERKQLVPPALIPVMLGIGVKQKKLQALITDCCGKRGRWLAEFNDAWNFSTAETEEELWQTGTPEQRKKGLADLRRKDPAKALEWLQQCWPQEDAAAKISFLEILSININEPDIPFLENLSGEKSKKVKDQAQLLLKQVPQSSVVQLYQKILAQSVSLKKEKTLLGLSSKMVLQVHLPPGMDETIFKTGIDKLSSTKEFTDEEYIVYQLAKYVPPDFWEQQLNSTPQDVIHLLQKDAVRKKLIPALASSVNNFRNSQWASAFMQHSEVFYADIISLLPPDKQDYYSNKFFEDHADAVIEYAVQGDNEWGIALTKNIFSHTAKNLYQYSRSFYSEHIHLIPVQAVDILEKCMPPDPAMYASWSNTSDYIIKLISLKIQIIKAFQQ